MYESQITFTLDTICPWASPSASNVFFTLRFDPYQLNADLPASANKNEWYLHVKHNDNPDAQRVFQEHMGSLAKDAGAVLTFDGDIGNTLHAHRVIQHFQEARGADTADRLVDALYRCYFAEGRHPAADDTLVEACVEAGVDEAEAKDVVADRERGEREVRQKLRMVGMDVDAVPVVTVEGRRRDITLTGAKEVAEYVKTLETIAKESS